MHLNDVAGFIGPEVFRTKEQLVRVCLEDTVMGKLHGLTIGLDICSTLHMDVTLDDLDWCIEQVMPANPAYLMALPTKNDPMLSYLTTAFQDHVRVREQFGYKVDDRMWAFFQRLGRHRRRGQADRALRRSALGVPAVPARQARRAARRRGPGRGRRRDRARARRAASSWRRGTARSRRTWIRRSIGRCAGSTRTPRSASTRRFPTSFPIDARLDAVPVATRSRDRDDYILHPPTGEIAGRGVARAASRRSAARSAARYDVQIVVSDGLNAYALTDAGHLAPYLDELRRGLAAGGFRSAPEHLVVTNGRVRAGYRIGEVLFGGLAPAAPAAVVHVIGERPGNGHHTFSSYVTRLPARVWARPGVVDHNHTRVISNIADTALDPVLAAQQTVALLKTGTSDLGMCANLKAKFRILNSGRALGIRLPDDPQQR